MKRGELVFLNFIVAPSLQRSNKVQQWIYKWTVITEDKPSIQLIFYTRPTPKGSDTSTKNDQFCEHHSYLDVINVWSLCFSKCIAQIKDVPLLSIFEISLQLAILFIFLKLVRYWHFFPSDLSFRVLYFLASHAILLVMVSR